MMNKVPFQRGPFFFLLALLTTLACNKYDEVQLADYRPEFAIPLLTSELSMEDAFSRFGDDNFITVDADGFMTMNYFGDVTARQSSEIFESIAQTEGTFPLFDTISALPFSTPNGFDLDYALINSGTMQILYAMSFSEPVTFKARFPNLITPNGEVYEYNYFHDDPNFPLFVHPQVDLTGYTLVPTRDSLFIEYHVLLESSGTRVRLDTIGLTLVDFTASYVEGYMGQEIYEIPRDTITIDFFENWTFGDVYFEDPQIKVSVINSFGFPVRSQASIMDVIKADGQVITLESPFIDSINIDYPRLDEVGGARTTEFVFDRSNSNIDEVLSGVPIALDYEMRALANPDRDTSIRGFMTDTSSFRVQVEVQLPLYGRTNGFVARDTIDVDFSDYEQVTSAEFKVITENDLPLELELQAYFLDSEDAIIDSLFSGPRPLIQAAEVNAEGIVPPSSSNEVTTFIEVDGQRFTNFQQANRVLVTLAFSSYNGGQTSVRIYNDQRVEVRMGMKLEVQQ
ncbi:MAG: hypothetical protein AAFW73_02220 [Bacteroidota bacterium]